jgi:DNA-binding Lrp family transcriptional regulator
MDKKSQKEPAIELSEFEKRVISAVQGDMPIAERPYALMAEQLGVGEDEFLRVLQSLVERDIVRRFGATLRHQKSGYSANVMVAWQVEESRVEEVGEIMASFRAVSHCYRRDPAPGWPYNLYTMVHGTDEASCRKTAAKMAEKSGVAAYSLLFSRRELKKTSMRYFDDIANSAK